MTSTASIQNIHAPSPWLREAHDQFEKERARFSHHAGSYFLDHDMSMPFEIWPEKNPEKNNHKKAMILIHGFLGTPYFMRPLADVFSQQGFYCYAPRLPGHGVCQEAMRCQDLGQILKNLISQIQEIQKTFETIYLCGFSFGGLLSTLLAQEAQENPDLKLKIKSLILFAPSYGITPLSKLIPPIAALGFGNMLYPSAANMNGFQNPAMYHWYPLCAVLPIIKGIKKLRNLNPSGLKDLPIFIIGSFEDAVVKLEPMLDFFNLNQNPSSKFYLYAEKKHQGLLKSSSKITLVNPENLAPFVLNLSHASLLIPPEDPIFGQDSPQYKNIKNNNNFYLGEKIPGLTLRKNLYRLFYNPDFKSLTQALLKFLDY